MTSRIIEADLTWTGTSLEPGIQLEIDSGGRIYRAGRLGATPTERLAGQALFPGMVNAHSHAFQRGLRGEGDRFPAGAGDFWTWQQAMYQLVESLDAERFHRLSVQAFREMLAAGITTVGEFHYFHHSPVTGDYAFDRLVIDAAREAGIRLAYLHVYYRTGGIGKPLEGGQRRFATASPEEYWDRLDAAAAHLDPATQSLGAVAHSIRAATPHEIASLHAEATRRGLPFHIHVEEQRREVEASLACYGAAPMAVLLQHLEDCSNVTAIHCTHTDPADMGEYLARGGRVCLCPLTEGNLGDGIPNLPPVHRAGGRIALGTDSNNRISMLEDMRWLEYGQRLVHQGRGILRSQEGLVARPLFEAATLGGADALNLPVGRLEPGRPADFIAVELGAAALVGSSPGALLETMVFGADPSVIAGTAVGGRWVYRR